MTDVVPGGTRIFDLITSRLPALVAYVGRDQKYRFANRAYEDWYGFGPGELSGRTVLDGVGAITFERIRNQIVRVLAGEPVQFDVTVTDARDGRERTLDVEYLADFSADRSEVQGYVVVAHDITVRKVAERALLERNHSFRVITETIPQGIWRCSPDGAADYCSRRFCEMVGHPAEALLGWGWASLIHPDDQARVLVEWQAARDAAGAIGIEFRVRISDGRYRWFMSLGNPFRDDSGTITMYFGTWTDIDEQKRIEIENSELLRRERAAVRARDEFLSVASHELKTPLTSLKLQGQLIKHLSDKGDPGAYAPARVDALVEQVDRQVNRLNRLVDDMLDISRIQTGRLKLERRLVNLDSVLRDAVQRLRGQFDVDAAGGVSIQTEQLDPACVIFADAARLEQVLVNLLTNALRFGEGHAAQLGVDVTVAAVTIRVRDQGRGIPVEMRERIFERFERAVPANEVSGLGLGLFIAKEIVLAHGGTIWVDGEGERGATFFIRLPTVTATVGVVNPDSSSDPVQSPNPG